MLRTLSSLVLRIIASISVIAILSAHPTAAAQQKPAPPSPQSQAQLEARVKQLETRLTEAEQKAASAAMEKGYITRVQAQYERYYEKAFNAQVWTLTILGLILTALFIFAGVFSFNIFDRRIDSALKDTSAQLRTEFTEMLAKETRTLGEENFARLDALEDHLTERINDQEKDLNIRSDFQFQCAQGLATGAGEQYAHARNSFRTALKLYKSSKPRKLFDKKTGPITVQNILISLKKEDKANLEQNAKKELADPLYNDLDEELALAALEMPEFARVLKERIQAPTQPVATEPNTGQPARTAPPPEAPPKADK
jgi:hypothetical protein